MWSTWTLISLPSTCTVEEEESVHNMFCTIIVCTVIIIGCGWKEVMFWLCEFRECDTIRHQHHLFNNNKTIKLTILSIENILSVHAHTDAPIHIDFTHKWAANRASKWMKRGWGQWWVYNFGKRFDLKESRGGFCRRGMGWFTGCMQVQWYSHDRQPSNSQPKTK